MNINRFFKKVREALGERDDIIVSGDRFIFPSEIFFSSGSDVIQDNGRKKLLNIATSLKEIKKKFQKKLTGYFELMVILTKFQLTMKNLALTGTYQALER